MRVLDLRNGNRCEETPFFSVIVPTYNNEKEIPKCIASIITQTYRNFELILVDDGSTDATPIICDQFASFDDRIEVIHKINEGVAAARNDGLRYSSGKYIYYVDADDWISDQLLWEAAKILESSDQPDIFVFGINLVINDQFEAHPCFVKPGMYCKRQLQLEVYPRMMDRRGRKVWMRVVSPYLVDKVIDRDLLMEHYCTDTLLFMGEDSVCAYECIYYAEKIYFSEHVMYYYNLSSESSMHHKYQESLLENHIRLIKYYRTHLGGQGNCEIECQINRFACSGFSNIVWQELKFHSSIYHSSILLKKKMRQIEEFPVCPLKGLSALEKAFVLLLSFRFLYLLLLIRKMAMVLSRLERKVYEIVKNMLI